MTWPITYLVFKVQIRLGVELLALSLSPYIYILQTYYRSVKGVDKLFFDFFFELNQKREFGGFPKGWKP